MQVLKKDILNVTRYDQLCSGLEAGCEAAVHAVNDLFNEADTHGFIQVDATNAFNIINRNVLLHNSKILCPEIARYLANFYIMPARLFIVGGKEIKSDEGTTQGDAVAMGMYALGLMPLLMTIDTYIENDTIKQIAFADDLTGIGKIQELLKWWNIIITNGQNIGYHVNQQKSWLVVKPEYFVEAKKLFQNYNIQITSDGRRHLGAAIGNIEFVQSYVNEKLTSWIEELNRLSYIAQAQPHAAYTAFTHGLKHKYTYLMRTIPDISELLKPLDDAINNFVKSLFNNYSFNEIERLLLSLPPKFGGMGIIIPSTISNEEYHNSRLITADTINNIMHGTKIYKQNIHITKVKSQMKTNKNKKHDNLLTHIKNQITDQDKLKALEASRENGASIWLTSMPIKEDGFALDKQTFWDCIYLRYYIPLQRIPTTCSCGSAFNVRHALTCAKGGFIINRHNELRDLTAEILD